jgi:hypothetical protein
MSEKVPLAKEERTRQYAAYSKRYLEIKAELMAKYPDIPESACGDRAMEKADEEFFSDK